MVSEFAMEFRNTDAVRIGGGFFRVEQSKVVVYAANSHLGHPFHCAAVQ